MKKYLKKLTREIRLKRYSYQTEIAYCSWVKRYLIFLHKNSVQGNQDEKVIAFLNNLVEKKNVSASTQNQALCALVFFYEYVLNRPVGHLENLKYASKKPNIPVVLSESEVKEILNNLPGVKKLIVSLLYGSGLRISECLRLRILDINFSYRQLDIPVILTPHSGHIDPPWALDFKERNSMTTLQFFSQTFTCQFDSMGRVNQPV